MSSNTLTAAEASGPHKPAAGFEGDRQDNTVRGAVRGYVDKLRGGDLGALPAILGIVVLGILFTVLRPDTFLTPLNLANLATQATPIIVLAMGLVFVLLLGEIDLSAGVVSGVCSAVLAQMLVQTGLGWPIAVLAAIAAGAVIGLFTGSLVGIIGIPSFVVTLALFLGFQGVTLRLIGQGGTVPVREPVIRALANENVPVTIGWILAVLVALAYAGVELYRWRAKRTRDLAHPPLALVIARIVIMAVVILGATAILSVDRALAAAVDLVGIPYAIPLVAVLLLVFTFVLSRTSFGRHMYAVGGNAEAARRAGINVTRIRVAAFVISSSLAAISGILATSRLSSVTPDAGAGNTLLYAVGAAVIGGTSLFGGRGRARDAVLGGLVIAIIANGLGLLGVAAYLNFIITGGVLLLAAGVDALARRRAASAR